MNYINDGCNHLSVLAILRLRIQLVNLSRVL